MGVAPNTLIPMIEGLVSTMPTNAPQSVGEWIKEVKSLLRLTQLRDQSDWAFVASANVNQATTAIRVGATTVYAVLIGTVSADSERDWFVMTDVAAGDFDGTAALDNDDLWVYQLPAVATAGTEEFSAFVFPTGIAFPAGLDVLADGRDGTNPTTNDIRTWLLYREA